MSSADTALAGAGAAAAGVAAWAAAEETVDEAGAARGAAGVASGAESGAVGGSFGLRLKKLNIVARGCAARKKNDGYNPAAGITSFVAASSELINSP